MSDILADKKVSELCFYAWQQAAKKSRESDFIPGENFNIDMLDMKTFLGLMRLSLSSKKLVWFIPFENFTCIFDLADEEVQKYLNA